MKKKREPFRKKLKRYAAELNADLPGSECWFWEEWERLQMSDFNEVPNEPFANTIPDVRNKKAKYIIEIDGAHHQMPEVKKRDAQKEKLWRSLGYEVYRIRAGNMADLRSVACKVEQRRKFK